MQQTTHTVHLRCRTKTSNWELWAWISATHSYEYLLVCVCMREACVHVCMSIYTCVCVHMCMCKRALIRICAFVQSHLIPVCSWTSSSDLCHILVSDGVVGPHYNGPVSLLWLCQDRRNNTATAETGASLYVRTTLGFITLWPVVLISILVHMTECMISRSNSIV